MDIQNNFTVAGGTPVTGDDLQKVQDQIIAPEQKLYVDSVNGSDETGDGTSSKPYKTINFAFTKVKNNVPTITFNLQNGTDPNTQYIYDVEPLDFYGKNNDTVIIQAWNWGVNWQKAKIRTKYGKLFQLSDNQGVHYYWGNFLIGSVLKVTLGGLDIDCNYYKNSSIPDYKNAITCYCTNIEIHNCTLEMSKYSICALGRLNSNISIHDTAFNITDSYVACSVGDLVTAKTDPTIDSAQLIEPLAVNTNYYASVSCIIRNNPPDSLINTGGTGFTNSILVVVKSWVN